ncbi:MAG: YitT family protein [Bacteroidetes bacterium]|nr:YitT family protein [Bacteroidales bacterium]MBU1009062.1 YitT family protein [Bacteroidota bacterium]
MAFIQKENIFSKRWLLNYFLVIVGSFILAAGFVLFITPYRIVPGGVYGIAIVLHYMFHLPVGLTALSMDIPLTLIGIRILGPRFGYKTVVGFLLTAFFVDGITYYYGEAPLVADEPLLSSIFGGVFLGLGLGLIFKSKSTSGGTDIVAMIISKYTRLPIGQLLIYVDSVIVLLGLLVFQDWKIPLYSLIVIFITGKVIDTILQGVSYDKTLFIISDKHLEIRDKIINDLNRGGTYIHGKGMFNGADKTIIFTVVNRREMAMLQEYIHQIDPHAFVTVINANEILGEGFKSLHEKVSS